MVGLVGLAGTGLGGPLDPPAGPRARRDVGRAGAPTLSRVLDGDHVGPLVAGLVPHPPLDGAGLRRLDVRREGLAGDVDVEVELAPRLVVDLVLDVEDRALAAGVGAREVELLLAGDRVAPAARLIGVFGFSTDGSSEGLCSSACWLGAPVERDEGPASSWLAPGRAGTATAARSAPPADGVTPAPRPDACAVPTIAASPASRPTTTATPTSATSPVMHRLCRGAGPRSPRYAPPTSCDDPAIVTGRASGTQPTRPDRVRDRPGPLAYVKCPRSCPQALSDGAQRTGRSAPSVGHERFRSRSRVIGSLPAACATSRPPGWTRHHRPLARTPAGPQPPRSSGPRLSAGATAPSRAASTPWPPDRRQRRRLRRGRRRRVPGAGVSGIRSGGCLVISLASTGHPPVAGRRPPRTCGSSAAPVPWSPTGVGSS